MNVSEETIIKELEKANDKRMNVKKLLINTKLENNTFWGNIRALVKDKEVRPFIEITDYTLNPNKQKGKPLKNPKRMGSLQLEEIYFERINKYETPQYILRLIDTMRSGDANAYGDFIKLCMDNETDDAEKIAYDLMSGITNGLRERIAFEFTYNKGQSPIKQTEYDPQRNEWTFTVGNYDPIKKEWDPPLRNYDYFTRK